MIIKKSKRLLLLLHVMLVINTWDLVEVWDKDTLAGKAVSYLYCFNVKWDRIKSVLSLLLGNSHANHYCNSG